MIKITPFRHVFLILTSMVCLSLFTFGGCAAREASGEGRPIQWNLSPEAETTFAYLLYDQALRREDEMALVESMDMLTRKSAPAGIFVDGVIWLMSRKSPLAPEAARKAIAAHPENVSLNLLLAEAYLDEGRGDDAIAHMRSFLKKYPDSLEGKLELALLLIKNDQYDEGQKILSSISGKGRNAMVEFYQAKALIGQNKLAEAAKHLQRTIELSPDHTEAMLTLAYIYEQRKEYAKAIKLYENVIKNNDPSPELALRLTSLWLKQDRPDKALLAASRGPSSPGFQLAVVTVFMEAGKFAEAETLLHKLRERPDAPLEIYFYLAILSWDFHKDAAKAIGWLEQYPLTAKNGPRALILRSELLSAQGKNEEALSNVSQAIKDHPEVKDFYLVRIRLLTVLKRYNDATEAASMALKHWPDDIDLQFLKASILDEKGDKKAAFKIMEGIIAANPKHYQALNYVGYTLADENRELERSLHLLEKAHDLSPKSGYIVDSLAWAQYRLKRFDEAWETIKKAVDMQADEDSVIWEHYGDIAWALGKRDEAAKGWNKALELKSTNSEEIRRKLSEL